MLHRQGRFGKVFFKVENIIGQPYGTIYEIQKDGSLAPSDEQPTDVMVTGMF